MNKMITLVVAQQALALREEIGVHEVKQGRIVMDDSGGNRFDIKVTGMNRAPRKIVFEVELTDHVLSALERQAGA